MISFRMLVPVVAMVVLPSVALSQTKDNKALQQLKDVEKSSQDAARTKNLEKSKEKSNQNIDTATKGAVRAGTPSTQTKAERDAAAISFIQASRQQPGPSLSRLPRLRRPVRRLPRPPLPLRRRKRWRRQR
jgi:hypothetical protein